MTIDLNHLSDEVLSIIEIREAQLLSWGFVSGSLDLHQELSSLINALPPAPRTTWEEVQKAGVIASDILDNLVERRLVFRLQDGNYRSRFSETIRLTYLLRQRFSEKDWFTAKRLVSDLKLQLQRRRYPQWSIPLEALEEELTADGADDLGLEVIRHLLRAPNGNYLALARFQKEAILKQLGSLRTAEDRAIVIGAGTGAGKTKAFYIPALVHIAGEIDPNDHYLQALAIYPRVELLKDQLAEAFTEARKLDKLLQQHGKRPISLGAYYAGTPPSAERLANNPKWYGWRETAEGYHCPFFSCPVDANHDLLWEKRDVRKEANANNKGQYGQHARLRCQQCYFETAPDHLLLTREQLRRQPPDILFTSTEMLNRRMSRANEHALFGIDQHRSPRLMLLDEIHTYEGIHGAQIAYLLRRWRHGRGNYPGQNLCIVGLSATLTQATDFFSRLTGIPTHHVDYIFPRDEDLIEEGIEYNVVLKGDPVAGTTLLSTSVQAAMLLGRILDPTGTPLSGGAFGQRIFAFTDKLDVINRWYHIMYDAEWKKCLSQYRTPDGSGPVEKRRAQGQVWDLPMLLGYDLKQPLPISRTTSQDPGVSQKTDLVIATSTLEVGFNDPTIGAVMQHKAPRSMASFLQRKGRAGRTRGMRPWMTVVTSAYGRDRWAFQHSESLFSPLLPPMDLPIENYYVRKIQAAFVLMDWAAKELKSAFPRVDIWQLLSSNSYYRGSWLESRRTQLHALLLAVLKGTRRTKFESYLEQALQLETDEALHRILWGEPRPLYLEVIPTLLRQLETAWRRLSPEEEKAGTWKDSTSSYPMPQFIPSALFAELVLPEVQIRLPQREEESTNSADEPAEQPQESMSLAQSIYEFAPGHANKRFVLAYRADIAHWIALPDDAQLSRNRLNLSLLSIDFDGAPQTVRVDDTPYTVYRPLEYYLEEVPQNVRSTSSAQLIWRSHFEAQRYGDAPSDMDTRETPAIQLNPKSPWKGFIDGIDTYTHADGTWVDVTRLAIGVRVDTRYHQGGSHRRTLYFERDDKDAAIGFTLAADALRFTIVPVNADGLRALPNWPDLYHHFGPEFFRHKLQHDRRLIEVGLSTFTIDWLWQLELSMLTATAVARQCTLARAAAEVETNRIALADRTLRVIFQSQFSESDDAEQLGRLHAELLAYMEDAAISAALREAAAVLWNDDDQELNQWLTEVYAASLGATLFAAITRLVQDIDPDDLIMDVAADHIWITETAAGGVGLIAKIVDALARRPRDFELQLYDTVHYCEREHLAEQLRGVIGLVGAENEALLNAFDRVRNQSNLPSLLETKKQLAEALDGNGIAPTRQLLVALNSKFLRPNSARDSDALIVTLVENWEQEEVRLGTAIDLRVLAVSARRIDVVEERLLQVLERVGGNQPIDDESQIFNLLQSLLWLTCHDSCPDCIEKWQPYQQLAKPSRSLLRSLLTPDRKPVTYNEPYWETKVQQALAAEYQVEIACEPQEVATCRQEVGHFLVRPVDVGYQRFFPVVERIRRQDHQWRIQLALRELLGD